MNKQYQRDVHFVKLAKEASTQSKCSSRKVGAVLVQDGSVVSIGRNGAPRGVGLCQDDSKPCPRREKGYPSGAGLEMCPAVHAEANAIIQAARNGIKTKGSTLYCYGGWPCKNCMGIMINAGIERIVFLEEYQPYDELSGLMAEQAGIIIDRVRKEDIE